MNEKLVFRSTDLIVVEQVCSILKDNKITFIKRYAGPGEYFTIIARNTFNREVHIYVNDEDYEKANELINEISSNTSDSIEITEMPDELKDLSPEEEKEFEEEYKKSKRNNSTIFKFIIVVPFLLIFLIALIMTITSSINI